jgi:hypothetical protein
MALAVRITEGPMGRGKARAGAQDRGTNPRAKPQSSLSSFHGSTRRSFAILAMLSIDTLRSERSTPLR